MDDKVSKKTIVWEFNRYTAAVLNLTRNCPFCDGKSIIYRSSVQRYQVRCRSCGTATKFFDAKSDAIILWNTRTADTFGSNP